MLTSYSRRVLLLSDTHGRIHPAVVELAAEAELVVHAGDIGSATVLTTLQSTASQLVAVRGNNDTPATWGRKHQEQLRDLPEEVAVDLPGGTLVIEHGHRINPASQRHQRLRKKHPAARAILYGHSHRQLIDDEQSPWIVNPGAAGRSRTFGGSGCILLTASSRRWRLQAFQFPLADWKP